MRPSAWSSQSRSITAAAISESRLPVGSSAQIEPGPAGERAGDRDALLLAAGELGGRRSSRWPRPTRVERLPRPLARLALGHPGEQERQLDVLGRGEDRDQVERLEDEAHRLGAMARALRVRELVDRMAVDEHAPLVDLVEARTGS